MSASTILLLFLLLSLAHFPSSCIADDDFPLFINCGSSSSVKIVDRTFISDIHPRQFRTSGDGSHTIKNTNSSADSLCKVARVFTKPFIYEFDIQGTATYILRFHFCDFKSSDPQLADSQFNVSASGHMLLTSSSLGKDLTNSSRVVKEFFLTVDSSTVNSKLRVYIEPSKSLAFMNALEVLHTRQNISDASVSHITISGNSKPYNGPKYNVLETIYRINVGGRSYIDNNYWRTWIPDDRYLINHEAVRNVDPPNIEINYVSGGSTRDDALDYVYSTAKQLNDGTYTRPPNGTWKFNVSKDTTFFVRVHFCDIVSIALGEYMFNFYVYNKFVTHMYPKQKFQDVNVPFYNDYMIDSGEDGILNISIGTVDNPRGYNRTYPFLNGIEIMQVKNGTAPEPPGDKSGSHLSLVVGLAVAGLVIVIIILVVIALVCRKKRKTKPVEIEGLQWQMEPLHPRTSSHNFPSSHRSSSNPSNLSDLHLHLKIPFVEIQQVTKNFDENLIIGEGGFGKVYEGILKDGRKVAVKRSNPDHGQGFLEFQAEIMVLSKIRHRHLVSLIGYCNEDNEMILVYEFMEKGSLRDHLYGPHGSTVTSNLTWQQRLQICIGAAKGLDYLHTGSDFGIIHRDVKSTNILLDENYMAKVADFGLSRLGKNDESQVFTDVKGTYGYLDPEYIQCLQLTEKSDVYSFGVVLLEVLTAKPVIINQVNLADWAMECYKHGQVEKIIDPSLAEEINQNSLKKFIDTVEKCLKENGVERPAMSDVCWDMEYALQLQKTAAHKETFQDDSMADASFSVPLMVVQRLQTHSYSEMDDDLAVTNTSTGEVFSQLKSDDYGR